MAWVSRDSVGLVWHVLENGINILSRRNLGFDLIFWNQFIEEYYTLYWGILLLRISSASTIHSLYVPLLCDFLVTKLVPILTRLFLQLPLYHHCFSSYYYHYIPKENYPKSWNNTLTKHNFTQCKLCLRLFVYLNAALCVYAAPHCVPPPCAVATADANAANNIVKVI